MANDVETRSFRCYTKKGLPLSCQLLPIILLVHSSVKFMEGLNADEKEEFSGIHGCKFYEISSDKTHVMHGSSLGI
jgi:hypothetical protein